PCDACHNPHIVRANRRNVANPFYTPLSKPSDHSHLWGDDANETLAALTDMYQPPYYYGSTTTFEPDGTAGTPAQQAAKMPDYISYCTDCHNTVNTIYSTTIQHFDPSTGTVTTGGNLYQIDWFSANGDYHGFRVGGGPSLLPPYSTTSLPVNANGAGFVVSCMDCHEAHGSRYQFLIREEVNGEAVGNQFSINNLGELCRRCHMDDEAASEAGLINRYRRNSWKYVHHVAPNRPYVPRGCGRCHRRFGGIGPDSCIKCHFHGGDDSILGYLATHRRTF
ncbi:cytochrome c3 family protein, partial [Desulfurobacterium sp.]